MKKTTLKIKDVEENAYLRGYDDGAREQAHVFEDMMESAEQVKGWNKYGNNLSVDYSAVLLVIAIMGVVIAILV